MFDVGQIEVLKGPQGTLRGVSAPSGAITLTTRKPDLGSYGGYIDGTYAEQNGRDVQGAINIPIIKDVLAIRGAAVWDQNNGDAVTSIHSPSKPRGINAAERISAIFQPSDNLTANVTYQHFDSSVITFTQVAGPGPGAFSIGPTNYPASYNPPIAASQRLAVSDQPGHYKQKNEVVTGNIDYRFSGMRLSYVGSYAILKLKAFAGTNDDTGNLVPGFDFGDYSDQEAMSTTHEIRLASDPSPDRRFDFTVGAFYRWDHVCCTVDIPTYGNGAFGPGPASAANAHATSVAHITYPGAIQEESLFGGLTLHLPWDTELSGGVRHIWTVYNSKSEFNGFLFSHIDDYETPTIYNVSLSHKITRDFMVYATTGTSFRPAANAIGAGFGGATSLLPADVQSLINHPSESATSYEVGFKSTWLDRRARLNVALYRQNFDGLVVAGPPVPYIGGNFAFAQSVKALVQGFDIDAAFQITHDWSVTAAGSYSDGKNQGTRIPCLPTDPGSVAIMAFGSTFIHMCPGTGHPTTSEPLWSATFGSEYTHPVTDDIDGFVRGLASYYPQNKRIETFFTAGSYALVNLYGGIRSHNGAWEVSVFAKNVFNTTQQTDSGQYTLSNNLTAAEVQHPIGYLSANTTPPRQVGVNIHYAWGSR
jgi:iron complex outermembrane receptor protein